MSGVLATTLVLCMMATSGVGQVLLFDAVPEDCTLFQLSLYSFRVTLSCPKGKVFSTFTNRCVNDDSYLNNQCPIFRTQSDIANVCEECRRDGGGVECVFASTTKCAAYINCSKSVDEDIYDNLPAYAGECEYPLLYNVMSRKCEDFTNVRCGRREEAKEPCQYERNLCGRSAHCKPCVYRYASCSNKLDGVQPWEGRNWTPYFAECKGQRTLNSGICPSSRNGSPRIFSVTTNRCDELTAIPRKFGGLQEDN